jgi:hypothetical protein
MTTGLDLGDNILNDYAATPVSKCHRLASSTAYLAATDFRDVKALKADMEPLSW